MASQMTLSPGSSVLCSPAGGQPITFSPIYLAVIASVPGDYVTIASLLQDPRTTDLATVPVDQQYVTRLGDQPWGFPLENTGLTVSMELIGWDSNDEPVFLVDASPVVQFRALRGNTP